MNETKHQTVRVVLVVGGLAMFGLAAIFCFDQERAKQLWLWWDSPLSLYFVAAMQAAIGAAMLWIGLSGELAALAAGALNLVVMMAGSALTLFWIAGLDLSSPIFYYAVGCALFALFNGWLFVWARRIPLRDSLPLPPLIRYSYMLFVAALAGLGIALLTTDWKILPWGFGEENADTPRILGWMFFGDAFYFLYALLYPRWRNACAQLCSFLAYDLVLLGPFLMRWPLIREWFGHLPRLPDDLLPNLVLYTFVLLYSGALGVYFLFINPQTRLVARAQRSHRD